MLEKEFLDIYSKFKLEFYRKIFARLGESGTTLSAVEIFCVEVIYVLDNPTIQEFANFIGISSPNAAYKVNNLIKKGYVIKEQSKNDKREFHLRVGENFLDYYGVSFDYSKAVISKIEERFDKKELDKFAQLLRIINQELF